MRGRGYIYGAVAPSAGPTCICQNRVSGSWDFIFEQTGSKRLPNYLCTVPYYNVSMYVQTNVTEALWYWRKRKKVKRGVFFPPIYNQYFAVYPWLTSEIKFHSNSSFYFKKVSNSILLKRSRKSRKMYPRLATRWHCSYTEDLVSPGITKPAAED